MTKEEARAKLLAEIEDEVKKRNPTLAVDALAMAAGVVVERLADLQLRVDWLEHRAEVGEEHARRRNGVTVDPVKGEVVGP